MSGKNAKSFFENVVIYIVTEALRPRRFEIGDLKECPETFSGYTWAEYQTKTYAAGIEGVKGALFRASLSCFSCVLLLQITAQLEKL